MGASSSISEDFEIVKHFNNFIQLITITKNAECNDFDKIIENLGNQVEKFFDTYTRFTDAGKVGGIDINLYFTKIDHAINSFTQCLNFIRKDGTEEEKAVVASLFRKDFSDFTNHIIQLASLSTKMLENISRNVSPLSMIKFYLELSIFDFALNVRTSDKPPYYTMSLIPCYDLNNEINTTNTRNISIIAPHCSGKTTLVPLQVISLLLSSQRPSQHFVIVISHQTSMIKDVKNVYRRICCNNKEKKVNDDNDEFDETEAEEYDEDDDSIMITSSLSHITELSQSNPYLPIISILSPLDALRLIHSIPNTEKFISKTIFIFDDVHMRTVETDVLIQDVYFSMMKAKKQEKKSIKMALMSTVPDDQFIRFLHPHQRMDVTNDVRKDVFKKEINCDSFSEIKEKKLFNEMRNFFDLWANRDSNIDIGSVIIFVPSEKAGKNLYKKIFKFYSSDNSTNICPLNLTIRRNEKTDDFYNRLFGQMLIAENERPKDAKTLFLLPVDATGTLSQEEKTLLKSRLPLAFMEKLSRVFITTIKNEFLFELQDLNVIFDTGVAEVEYFDPIQSVNHIHEELLPLPFMKEHRQMLGLFSKGIYYQFNLTGHERPNSLVPSVKRSDLGRQLLLLRSFGIKLEEQKNLPNEPNRVLLDQCFSLLQKLQLIDVTPEKELTPLGKEAAKFSSVSPFFALATAKFTDNQQFAFLCSLLIENSRNLILNSQAKLLCKHFERESDVVTLLGAISEISESELTEDENIGLSIGVIYSIYSEIENAFGIENGRESVTNAVKWSKEQPGGTLAMVDKFVSLIPQEEFIKKRRASFKYVLGTGQGSEPTLVYKAKEIFKFKKEEKAKEEEKKEEEKKEEEKKEPDDDIATINFAKRPGWLGLQSPGKIIVLSLIIEEESRLNRGLIFHRNVSPKKPNLGVVGFEVNNPSLNSFFFVSLFEAYWGNNEMTNNFVGIYYTPTPIKESAFLIHMTNNDDRIFLNYCPLTQNVDDLMKSAIPLLSSLIPFVPRSIISKVDNPFCAVEINGHGTSQHYSTFIHLINEPDTDLPFVYPINKTTLEYAKNNIDILMKTMPSIRFAITGECFYYRSIRGKEVETDLTYPDVNPTITSVFDDHHSSHLVLIVDKTFPNKPAVPPLSWMPIGDAAAAPAADNETDLEAGNMIVDVVSKIMNGFGFAKRSGDIFFVTLGGGFPKASKMAEGTEVPESIRGKIDYAPDEDGAFKNGVYPLIRYFMHDFTVKQKLIEPIPIIELGSTNSWPNYPSDEGQRENILNEINTKLHDHFHHEVQSFFAGHSMIIIRIDGLPEDLISHSINNEVWNDEYQPCKADAEIRNILNGIGIVDLQVSEIIHEPTINICVQRMRRFSVTKNEFIEHVQKVANQFGFLLTIEQEYFEGADDGEQERQGVLGQTNVELIGMASGIVFATLITKEFKAKANNDFFLTSTIAGVNAMTSIYPHLGPAPTVLTNQRAVKISPSEIEALKEKISMLGSSGGRKRWKLDTNFNILIVPASQEAQMREMMRQVRDKDEDTTCLYLCEPPQMFLPQSLYVYQQDGTVRTLGVCQPCIIEHFRNIEDLNYVIDPITKLVNRKKLGNLMNNMIAFPFVADGTEVDGVYWPQIPIGQAVWTLMSGPDEIIKYTKAWFTVIIDFVIRKASNYFTYCPNHQDIPYRTPGKGKKIKCPYCDMIYCDECMEWHNLSAVCTGNQSGLKRCPNCHVPTFKYDGCNHITCPCGKHWCYKCEVSEIYNTGGECYTHMSKVHGGYNT